MATRTFGFTGGWKKFVVPAGITQVFINAVGGGSGSAVSGRVTGQFPCNPGDVLWISVGQHGKAAAGRNGGGVAYGGGGAGGDGRGSGDGGFGGGGATVIRRGMTTGTIIAVAGGAGGKSGDEGDGGRGGGSTADDGNQGNAGDGTVFAAQGGTQTNPGNGGSSGGGKEYAGHDAGAGVLGGGGRGASAIKTNTHGGGGGGGGYTGGGGGQASAIQNNPGGAATRRFPGGGGGGGCSYAIDAMHGVSMNQGGGTTGDGSVVLTWSDHPVAPLPPIVPTDVQVNGVDESEEMATKSTGAVTISAKIDSPNIGEKVALVIVFTEGLTSGATYRSALVQQTANDDGQNSDAVRVAIAFTNLPVNTLYKAQLYTIDGSGRISKNLATGLPSYTSISFWTARPPEPPELLDPDENSQIPAGIDIPFAWNYGDPDGGNVQGGYRLLRRTSRTPLAPAGPWITLESLTADQAVTLPAALFRGNTLYDWTVATRDPEGLWGPTQTPRSFYIVSTSTPPLLTSPVRGQAVEVTSTDFFEWIFRDPDPDATQVTADLRYRVVGSDEWTTVFGEPSPAVPGNIGQWPLSSLALQPYQNYEWEVRTYSSSLEVSDWSEPENFWAIPAAGSGLPPATPLVGTGVQTLGYGTNRAEIYLRGGKVFVGELSGISSLQWNRVRDNVGTMTVTIDDFDDDLLQLLKTVHCWAYELVIFRDGPNGTERVAEGPIVRIKDVYDSVEIGALDCMGYLQRRDIRQGYADNYQLISGVQVGLRTVVDRAGLVIKNALAYDDPNLLPYLTLIRNSDDARQSQVVPDYSKTVQENIDDMAENLGLDYTTVGRRIILWDTHRMIGRLPEMTSADFLSPPTITEYGMQACNHYAVTDGSGVYGIAETGLDEDGQPIYYGWLEMLASAYGTDAEHIPDASTLTPAAREALTETFAAQAERNIAHRWPVPIEVHLPENTSLSPEANVGINQLIPGVWIPLRAQSRIRVLSQMQKLDQVTVTQTRAGETIAVTMSPAPLGGQDPDLTGDVIAQ